MSLVMGLSVSVLVLILTLNLTASIAVFALVISLIIFSQSFSKGWLFLFSFILLFPAIKLGNGSLYLHDILLIILSLAGITILALKNGSAKAGQNNLLFPFFLLFLLGTSIIVSGFLFKQAVEEEVWILSLSFVWFYISLFVFQYLFLSYKRLRLFFAVIMVVGALHSAFGLAMYIGGWQTSGGLGISTGKIEHMIFTEARYRVNGFFGSGFEGRVGSNALVPFLLISIPVTLGFYLEKRINKAKKIHPAKHRNLLNLLRGRETKIGRLLSGHHKGQEFKVFDIKPVIFNQASQIGEKGVSRYTFIVKEYFEIFILLLQVVALLLTFSYASFIFLNVGLLVMGILLRNKRMATWAAATIVIFTLVIPGIHSSWTSSSQKNISDWFSGFSVISNSWFLGNGWGVTETLPGTQSVSIKNSYLYIWNYYGILGLIVFLFAAGKYFYDVYSAYRKSDGGKRIWLIVIISIFVELAFEALTSNVLVFGPAALVFWLLYGAVINLREKPIMFGITETKLIQ